MYPLQASKTLFQSPDTYHGEAEKLREEAEAYLKRRNPEATKFDSEDEYDKFVPIFWR